MTVNPLLEKILKYVELLKRSHEIHCIKYHGNNTTHENISKCHMYLCANPCPCKPILGLQKSISVKNKLLANFTNKKNPILKEKCHIHYKKYRNLLSALMKKSKQAYYDRYFERNWNNIKNTSKGIKFLISLNTVASSIPTVLSLDNGDTITHNQS